MSYGRPVEVCGSVWVCGALTDYNSDYSKVRDEVDGRPWVS